MLAKRGLTSVERVFSRAVGNHLKSSEVDTCLYTKNGIILILFVDDAILISPDRSLIDREINSLQHDYVLTDDGELKDYLGTRFTKQLDGSITLTHP